MRARIVFPVAAILLLAGFTALNWPEFVRPVPLSFGFAIVQAPLGLILFTLMTLVLIAFAISSAYFQRRNLLAEREYQRDLKTQRELADKAEASRFFELREHIDTHVRESRDRETTASAAMERMMVTSHHDVQSKLQALNDTLNRRMGEVDARLAELRERMRIQVAAS